MSTNIHFTGQLLILPKGCIIAAQQFWLHRYFYYPEGVKNENFAYGA